MAITTLPAHAVAPITSNGQLVTGRTDATTKLVIAMTGVNAAAQVKVDVSMINTNCAASYNTSAGTICHLTPGTSVYTTYTPCANDSDPVVGGCESTLSNYYKIIDPGEPESDFSHGITIDRNNAGYQHNFALRVTRAYLEVTPLDTETYGGTRVRIEDTTGTYGGNGFPAVYEEDAHAFRSKAIGQILLPTAGAADSARYSGNMRSTGSTGVTNPLPVGAVAMNWFGDDATTVHPTSNNSMVEYGFGGGQIEDNLRNWRSRVMFRGKYQVNIFQTKDEFGNAVSRRWTCTVTVAGNVTGSNFNFGPAYDSNLGRADLGCKHY